jgi:hypothetical protein
MPHVSAAVGVSQLQDCIFEGNQQREGEHVVVLCCASVLH